MAIGNIVDKITKDAKKEAARIIKVAEDEAALIIKQAKEKSSQKKKALCLEANAKINLTENKELVEARLEAKNIILEEKQQLIADVFEKMLSSLKSIKQTEYTSLLKKILSKLKDKKAEVIFSNKDQDVGREIIKGLSGNLSLSTEKRDTSGGFILKEGKIETNYTLLGLINSQREKLEPKVANTLFNKKDK
ncbi:MAG: hypothetical protein C4562_03205 [Actinobacteria bacterium]|nr:MAG: hypothetical protein C4562_03205 [Actinomycetota bacterium]